MARNPFASGGTSAVSGGACASSTKNHHNWYNPCSFTNPWDAGNGAHALAPGTYVTDTATALNYLGGRRDVIPGPGYQRVNMSIFKAFKVYHEQNLEFRSDIFNLFNTPALANPSNTGIASNGGQISGTRSLQNNAPDSRFIQLSLRYAF